MVRVERVGLPRQRQVNDSYPEGLTRYTVLMQARTWLRQRLRDGEKCPCCGQYAKIYRRSIHASLARSLIRLHQAAKNSEGGWVHVPTAIGPACEIGKARYWGLVEEATVKRDDGGRKGYWRLTPDGQAYVRGHKAIPRYALLYDGRCLGFEGPLVDIRDALADRFDYKKLMRR